MSTTSPNKQYTVPTVGGDNYNWGTELNVTLGLLDQNLGGSLSVSVAGGANVALTAAQAANLRLTFTGALTASIDVSLPANLGGLWQVTNATTGAYSLTLLTAAAGSTGVAIPQGQSRIVFSDGTNVVLGQPAVSTTSVVSTAQSIGASNSNTNYVATGAFTATIAQSTTLGQNWTVTLDAQAGAVTVAINAADVLMVNGATFATGTGTTFPQGSSATLTTDAAGHIYAVTAMTGTGTAGHLVTWTSPNILGDGGRLGTAAAQDIGIGPNQIPNMNAEGALALGPWSASGPRLLVYSGPGTNPNYFAGLGINIGQAPNSFASFVGSGSASYWSWTVGVGAYPYSAYVDVARLDQSGNLTLKGGVTVGATFNADGTISGGNAVATLDQLTGAAGTVCNAKMSLTAASSSAAFSAEQIVVATSLGGAPLLLPNYSQTINLATTGAGGMDTGSAPTSGFVSLYAIYGTAGTSILACNATTSSGTIYSGAHMPSGYAYSALIGVWPTNSSGQFVIGSLQDRRVNIVLTVAFTGAATATNTYQTLSLSSIVPPNAVTVSGVFGSPVSGSYSPAIAIASNTSGVGEQLFVVNANGLSSDGFYMGAPFDNLIMTTAQQMAWKCTVDTTARNQIAINGYCF